LSLIAWNAIPIEAIPFLVIKKVIAIGTPGAVKEEAVLSEVARKIAMCGETETKNLDHTSMQLYYSLCS